MTRGRTLQDADIELPDSDIKNVRTKLPATMRLSILDQCSPGLCSHPNLPGVYRPSCAALMSAAQEGVSGWYLNIPAS